MASPRRPPVTLTPKRNGASRASFGTPPAPPAGSPKSPQAAAVRGFSGSPTLSSAARAEAERLAAPASPPPPPPPRRVDALAASRAAEDAAVAAARRDERRRSVDADEASRRAARRVSEKRRSRRQETAAAAAAREAAEAVGRRAARRGEAAADARVDRARRRAASDKARDAARPPGAGEASVRRHLRRLSLAWRERRDAGDAGDEPRSPRLPEPAASPARPAAVPATPATPPPRAAAPPSPYAVAAARALAGESPPDGRLERWLGAMDLGHHAAALRSLGASRPEHLVDLTAEDFDADALAGLRPLERRRLLRHVVALARANGRPTVLIEPEPGDLDHESPLRLNGGGDDDALAAPRPEDRRPSPRSPRRDRSPPRCAVDFLPPAPKDAPLRAPAAVASTQ